jgi:hypothetical protein
MLTRLSLSLATSLLTALALAQPAYQAVAQTSTETTKKKKPDKPANEVRKQMGKAMKSGDVDEKGVYQMAGDELAMDCKKLTGAMLITITRLKDARSRSGVSSLAESGHKTMPMLFGGSTAGSDRQASLARERAKLDAYNRQLAAKKCKTLDIEAELVRAPEAPTKY